MQSAYWLTDAAIGTRQLAMQRLLEACKTSKVSDIHRAALFLERALEVRASWKQSKQNRVAPRQATASKRKAAQQDNPLSWD